MSNLPNVLVTDFDGTVTRNDFYKLVVERFLSPSDLGPWEEYRAGRLTHFQAIQSIFHRIREPESRVLELVRDMQPDPRFPESVAALKNTGWDVVVASAGCAWYVSRILKEIEVDITVYANPGEYSPGGPLNMFAPNDSPFYCPETGIGKAKIVRFYRDAGKTVAYAGDGFADESAARLVPDSFRFAKSDLAEVLDQRGVAYHPFSHWSEIADALLNR